jgi:hypothetical protein
MAAAPMRRLFGTFVLAATVADIDEARPSSASVRKMLAESVA